MTERTRWGGGGGVKTHEKDKVGQTKRDEPISTKEQKDKSNDEEVGEGERQSKRKRKGESASVVDGSCLCVFWGDVMQCERFFCLHVFAYQWLFINIIRHLYACDIFESIWIVGRFSGVRASDIGFARLDGGITRGLEERDKRLLFSLLDATNALLPFFFSLSMLILEGGV